MDDALVGIALNWLQAKLLETDAESLVVARQEFHEYLLSAGVPVQPAVHHCKAAGWIEEAHLIKRVHLPSRGTFNPAAVQHLGFSIPLPVAPGYRILPAIRSAATPPAKAGATGRSEESPADRRTRKRRVVDLLTDARDKWIYEQCHKLVPYDTIAIQLKRKTQGWQRIDSKQGIRAAAERYAKRHDLPEIPPRQEI